MNEELRSKLLSANNRKDYDTVFSGFYQLIIKEVYNDKEVREHLCRIFNVNEQALKNVLNIDEAPPIDDFE